MDSIELGNVQRAEEVRDEESTLIDIPHEVVVFHIEHRPDLGIYDSSGHTSGAKMSSQLEGEYKGTR